MTSHSISFHSPASQVRAMASMIHPNIVRLLGYCTDVNPETREQEQIIMYEFMEGGDLQQYVDTCE